MTRTLRRWHTLDKGCWHHFHRELSPTPADVPEDAPNGLRPVTLALFGLAVLLAQEVSPDTGDIWRLGVIAVALLVGAAVTYRYTTLPERARADRAEAREAAAQEREREAYQVTVPPLTQLTTTLPAVLAALQQKAQ